MTEEQAKKKWCPIGREMYRDYEQYITTIKTNCIASDCMMWKCKVLDKAARITDILADESRLLAYYNKNTQPPIYSKERIDEVKKSTQKQIETLEKDDKHGYCGLTSIT